MDYIELERHLGAAFSSHGFMREEVVDPIDYHGRPAGAVFYRALDCKLQICWSLREGSEDFMLAGIDAPNEFGLVNKSKRWHFMLRLDDTEDGLTTPLLTSSPETWWEWRAALFEAHITTARSGLLSLQ